MSMADFDELRAAVVSLSDRVDSLDEVAGAGLAAGLSTRIASIEATLRALPTAAELRALAESVAELARRVGRLGKEAVH